MTEKYFNPSVGDILFADRVLYKHYGIYVGDNQVIHFAGPEEDETNPVLADIIQTTMEEFHKGDPYGIEPAAEGKKPFPAEEIVQRAKSCLGKKKGCYNLVDYNCEHFANWCRYGEARSKQVDNYADGIADFLYNTFCSDFCHDFVESKTVCSMEDVLSFFRDPEVVSELKKNSDLVACAVKEEKDGSIFVTACIFDKNKNEVSGTEKNIKIWKCRSLDDRLTEAFGDKEMILFS